MTFIVVLRPEPGNAATAARVEAAGFRAVRMPIFEARALAWEAPDPVRFDALLVTSAQAPRLAGAGLAVFAGLPVIAVGARTAAAARTAGMTVAVIGERDATDAIVRAEAAGYHRLLHLAGRDRTESTRGVETVAVYENVQTREPAVAPGGVVLLHSARAAQALAAAPVAREAVGIVAISAGVLAAAGPGWRAARAADRPDDAAMIAQVLAIDRVAPHRG